jgi:hypothetical protein
VNICSEGRWLTTGYLYEYDQEGRRSKTGTFNEFGDDNIATNVTIYECANDEVGNWIQRTTTICGVMTRTSQDA